MNNMDGYDYPHKPISRSYTTGGMDNNNNNNNNNCFDDRNMENNNGDLLQRWNTFPNLYRSDQQDSKEFVDTIINKLGQIDKVKPIDKNIKGMKITLLEHQQLGVAWMQYMENDSPERSGGLLCDMMGLGKTIQVIALIKSQRDIWWKKYPNGTTSDDDFVVDDNNDDISDLDEDYVPHKNKKNKKNKLH